MGTVVENLEERMTQNSPANAKIALFRSLFRGREDVYPLRFESRKTGRSGYAPACANEWVRGVCEKPRIKCSDCPNRREERKGAEISAAQLRHDGRTEVQEMTSAAWG